MKNPYKKLSKINPQPEKGTRRITNDVYMALILTKLSGAGYQITLFIIHKTWGFGKLSDKITYSQMMKATNLSRPTVINTIKEIEYKQIMVVNRKLVKGGLPFNEYLFNKYYDTWVNSGKPIFTSSQIKKLKSYAKLVKDTLPVKSDLPIKDQNGKKNLTNPNIDEIKGKAKNKTHLVKKSLLDGTQTGKISKHKLVKFPNKTSKEIFTHKRNYTKETITKETIILLQIKTFLSQFPLDIKNLVEEYIEIAKMENKTKNITLHKTLRLVNELYLLWATCEHPIEKQDFKSALQITVNKQVSNINYVKAVKNNIIKDRSQILKKGKENKEIIKEAVYGYSRNS